MHGDKSMLPCRRSLASAQKALLLAAACCWFNKPTPAKERTKNRRKESRQVLSRSAQKTC